MVRRLAMWVVRRAVRTVLARVMRTAPVTVEDMEESLAVEHDNPVLKGVLSVTDALREECVDALSNEELGDRERAFMSGKLAALREHSELVWATVKAGNKRKVGTVPHRK
jgi:hypothetical protein